MASVITVLDLIKSNLLLVKVILTSKQEANKKIKTK